MKGRVLVTGASGFIAGLIVERLLAGGYRVRGTVRSRKRVEDLAVLRGLPGADDRLEFVAADLLTPGAFDTAADDCDFVIHTASPYVIDVTDAQGNLVDPAVNGTVNVLHAATLSRSVRRVVLTSSMAAMTDEPDERVVLTEDHWNERSSLERNPYYYAKTMAERAAWGLVARERPLFTMAVINPFMVMGPSLTPGVNTSNRVILDLLTGVYPGILSLTWGIADVRDVAEAHVRAMENPAAQGRYICAGDTMSMRGMVAVMKAHGLGARYRLPSLPLDSAIGNLIVRAMSRFESPGVRSYLRTHLGGVPRYDAGRIRRDLGLVFRPVEETVIETVQNLEHWGHLKPA